jgi:hypothetical protein
LIIALVDSVLDRPEDSELEVANMKEGVGKMIPFPSIWGHCKSYFPFDFTNSREPNGSQSLKICLRSLLAPQLLKGPSDAYTNLPTGAGGPGDSKEDVKWLDEKLREIGL